MNTEIHTEQPAPSGAMARFFAAPLQARSYANVLYLLLSFPLGIAYFVFLTVGLALGLGLTIIWVGLPILAVVFAASWGLTALERRMAIHLLGARVPPMAPPSGEQPAGFWKSLEAFFRNPVTWKGMGYLFLKFPLGVASFVVTVFFVSLTAGFLFAPFFYSFGDMQIFDWYIDTLPEALACSLFGVVLLFVSLNAMNGFAAVWRGMAGWLLGSERFA